MTAKPLPGNLCLVDLDTLIAQLQERYRNNLDEARSIPELSPVQEARFEVGMLLLRDLMHDLHVMRDQWAQGGAAYRVTEQQMAKEQPCTR